MNTQDDNTEGAVRLRSALVKDLFVRWERAKVLYVNWKSTDHLEAALRGETDLDVLVDTKSIDSALRTAHDAGFRMLRTACLRSYPAVWDYVAYDPSVGKWIHLHFHAQIICGDRWVKAYHLPFERGVLASRVWEDELETWIIAPAFELVVLFYRMNAKYPRSWHKKKKILAEIAYICRQAAGKPLPADLDAFLPAAAKEALGAVIRSGDVDARQAAGLRRGFDPLPYRRMDPAAFRARNGTRFLYRLAVEFSRRKLHRYGWGRRDLSYGGYLAAFVGVDGSGKTTNIEQVRKIFAAHMNVEVVFFGSGKSGASILRKAVMSLFGFKATFASHKRHRASERRTEEDAPDTKKLRPRPPLYYLLWQHLCLKDKEKALVKARRALANGKLVFADRWPQDQLPGRLDGARLSAWTGSPGLAGRVARREAAFLSALKLLPLRQAILLRIDPETSLSRKPGELTREEAADLISDLDLIAWPSGCDKTVIDAKNPPDAVRGDIVSNIWRGMLEHS